MPTKWPFKRASLIALPLLLCTSTSTFAVPAKVQEILDDFLANHNVSCQHSRFELVLKVSVYRARPESTFIYVEESGKWQQATPAQRCDQGDTYHSGHCFRAQCEQSSEEQKLSLSKAW